MFLFLSFFLLWKMGKTMTDLSKNLTINLVVMTIDQHRSEKENPARRNREANVDGVWSMSDALEVELSDLQM